MAQPNPNPTSSPLQRNRQGIRLIAIFIVVGAALAVLAFVFVRSFVASWSMTSLPGVQISSAQATPSANGTPDAASALQAPSGPTPIPWDGTSRVTLLLMGLDFRDWQANDPLSRTDSMWLLTIDPISKTAGMMSIPRDTWVNIPGFDYAKINTAFFLGQANKLPGGGAGLAVKTVEAFLGVPINYYAQIDFQAFSDFIDILDGIYIDVPEEIKVDPIGP
ncbi:MAG TPA: LCP family protein, partial [Anaerolineaceae bacterium]